MLDKILNNRIYVLYVIPFILGLLSTLSFQPFNFTIINFIILPIFFFLIIYIKKKSKNMYRKKPFLKNLFLFGFIFGFGFYLSGIFWVSYSLTFNENFKFLIPFAVILIPLFLALFVGIPGQRPRPSSRALPVSSAAPPLRPFPLPLRPPAARKCSAKS